MARPVSVAPETIVEILAKADAGAPVSEICRAHHISPATYYRWRRTFARGSPSLIARIQHLERTLRDLAVRNEQQAREIEALRSVIRGND